VRITAIAAIIIKEEQQDRDSFLKQQVDKLTFVSPSSVLNCYLNGNAIRVDPQTVSDTIFPFKFNCVGNSSQNDSADGSGELFFFLRLFKQVPWFYNWNR